MFINKRVHEENLIKIFHIGKGHLIVKVWLLHIPFMKGLLRIWMNVYTKMPLKFIVETNYQIIFHQSMLWFPPSRLTLNNEYNDMVVMCNNIKSITKLKICDISVVVLH